LKGFRVDIYLFIAFFFCYQYLRQFSCHSDTSETSGSTSNAFIFSLRNNEDLGPFKSNVTNPARAIYKSSGYGPTFGWGYDIHIADNAISSGSSYSYLGGNNDYFVPSGVQDKYTILAGSNQFTPDEVEVFYLG